MTNREYDKATSDLHTAIDEMERAVAPAAAGVMAAGDRFIRSAYSARQSARKISDPAMPAVRPPLLPKT